MHAKPNAWSSKGLLLVKWDDALEGFGMAMGILAVFDMAGVDVGVNIHKANADRYPPDPAYYQADFALHAAGGWARKTARATTAMSLATALALMILKP